MQKLKKYLKVTLFILGIIIILIATAFVIIGNFYGEKVKQIIVAEISNQLNIEVSVKEIDFSILSNFPNISVDFSEIQTSDKSSLIPEALLKAGKLSLLFDIYDILYGNYTIDKIVLKDAFLHLITDKDGKSNFDIFKPKDTTWNEKVEINLQKVMLSNVAISYLNLPSDQEYIFKVHEGRFKGAFLTEKYLLEAKGDFFSTHIRSGEIIFLKEREIEADFIISIDKAQGIYLLKEVKLATSGLAMSVDGAIQSELSNKNLNLAIRTEKTTIPVLMSLIPNEYKEGIKNYPFSGNILLDAKFNGDFSGDKIPRVVCDFVVENGKFTYNPSGLTLKNISFKGIFDNGQNQSKSSYSLKLSAFSADIIAGQIEGELSITNFIKPLITASVASSLNLDKLDEIIRIEDLKSISGNMVFDLQFCNQLKNLHQFTISDFISSTTKGNMKIRGVNVQLKNNTVAYNDLTGSFRFNNKDLLVENFSGKINASDFSMKGYLLNILAYAFLPGENVRIKADFSSSHLNMNDLLSLRKDKSGATYRLKFSDRLNFDLNLQISEFTFGTFHAQNIRGNAVMQNNKLTIRDAVFNTMEGKTTLSGSVDGNYKDKFWVMFTAGLEDENIQKMFYQLGEFGQQNITSNHIRGRIDATIYYKSFIDPELNIDPKSVYALGDLIIREGELIKYSPLYKLSKYIKQKELEHIRFSTLKNQIEIKEQMIYIPEMDIESNTLNLKIFGNHSFENIIDYHVRVLLSELLSKRDRKKEEEIEGIFAEDDGLGRTTLFLRMTGNAENPDIRYDTKEMKKKLSADMVKEKQEIKDVLKREFNKNTGEQNDEKNWENTVPEKGKTFKIEWDEEQPSQTKKTELPAQPKSQPNKKGGKKDFIIEWDEDKDTLR